jgi:RNA polymerase-binding transcription factor DksA
MQTSEHHLVSTKDILGTASPQPPIDARWRREWDLLMAVREGLVERLGSQDRQSGGPNFADNIADRGTDEYDVESALGLLSSDQNALYEIDQAIRRIQDGTYGICEATGQPIPEERLEAIPWTRFARDVEETMERQQQARKPKHVL